MNRRTLSPLHKLCQYRRTCKRFFALFFITLIGLFPLPAAAAQLGWHLVPSLSISETYDSNLFSRESAEEDFVSRLGGNLTALYSGPDVSLRGDYLVQYQTYARHPKENGILQDGNFEIDLNRWFRKLVKTGTVTITEDFTFTPELRDYYFDDERQQLGSLSSYGIRTERTDSYRNAFALDLAFPPSSRWDLHGRYSNLLTEYKDPTFTDILTNSLSLGTEYGYTRETLYADLGVSYFQRDGQDSHGYTATAGLRHAFTQEVTADLNGTLILLETKEENRHTTAWGSHAVLSKRGQFRTYTLGYSRTLNPASGTGAAPPLAQLFYVNFTGILSREVTTTLRANYAINESLVGERLKTRSYNLSAGVSYAIRMWLRANLTASLFDQESENIAAEDIQKDLISITLTGTWNSIYKERRL